MSAVDSPATRVWREALDHIDSLLQLSIEHRQRALDDLQVSRPQLHPIVVALLDAERQASDRRFLETATSGGTAQSALQPDCQLGPYRLVRIIGQGGMGEVWLARRDDGLFDGEVAIKTLHPYFSGGALRERFLREANMLGRLTHPNIARLLDAGVTSDAVVYLVLEYVHGVAINAWCDARKSSIHARLDLFLDVCAAVADAHANLIVHRDLKPSNVLVSDVGQVKLLDFGVAKLIEADTHGDRTELTRLTGRIFTPEYAAPEQILGEAITTATDVYALGVLLHVLLTGTRPYAGEGNAVALERAVLHDEPIRASVACVQALDAMEIAAARATTPQRLQHALAADIDSIIAKALQKAPADRYASVLALAEDVRRHLNHEPILARAESPAARAKKFVRRHRFGVAATAGIAAVVVAGVAGVLWQAEAAREQARRAEQEAQEAQAVKDFLLGVFNVNSANSAAGVSGRNTTAAQLLDSGAKNILQNATLDPSVRVELMTTLGQLNFALDQYDQVEALHAERIRYVAERFGEQDLRMVAALLDMAELKRTREQFDAAREHALRATKILGPDVAREPALRARAEVELAEIAYITNDVASTEARDRYRTAVGILERQPASRQLALALLGLGRSYETLLEFDEAIEVSRRGIAIASSSIGPRSVETASGHHQIARALMLKAEYDAAAAELATAIDVFTFAVGEENGLTGSALLDAGRLAIRRGRPREAAPYLDRALAARIKVEGPTDPWIQDMRYALALASYSLGDWNRAEQLIAEALAALPAEGRRELRTPMLLLRATLHRERGRLDASFADIERAVQIAYTPTLVPGYREETTLALRAETLAAAGRTREAREKLAEAARLNKADPKQLTTLNLRLRLAAVATDLADGRAEAASAAAREISSAISAAPVRAQFWEAESLAASFEAQALFILQRTASGCSALDSAIELRAANALPADPRLESMRRHRAQACNASRAAPVT